MVGMYLSVKAMSHGGAREGSGRPYKWVDAEGNPLEAKPKSIPVILTDKDIQELVIEKTKKKDKAK
jgi:hypothetical protein